MVDNAIDPATVTDTTGVDVEPADYPRRVLLAVSGLTPQVVTETVYALAMASEPAFVPTEILLVTTTEGAQRARLSLLSDTPGWLARLCNDYDLPRPCFDLSRIRVLTDARGEPLADIRTVDENALVADQLVEIVRELTAADDTALHVSLAGGRKTLGYYAGYALSLFGRPQDRLSHVLVSEPFEQSWEFFYPTPYSRVIVTREDKLADTRTAQVTLAPIPYVRLRQGLPERLLAGQASFGESVAAAQRALQPPGLVIDPERRCIRAAGEVVELNPAPLAFYALLARRCLDGQPAVRWDDPGLAGAYLAEYRVLVGEYSGDYERAEKALADGMSDSDFDQRKARTNKALRDALGPQLAARYEIQTRGRRPETRSSLDLDPDAIRFAPIDPPAPAGAAASLPDRPAGRP